MSGPAFLEVVDVHRRYEAAPLLRGVSFTVERGEIACLLGPSGGGKTTLLRIIAGLTPPERGQIWLNGEEITHLPPHRRGIVLMFQDYALFPHRTVAENVAFGLRMGLGHWSRTVRPSRRAIAARVAEMLRLVGLEGFEGRDVNTLSGGEQQRVALARSLAPQPRLLLLDEPLGALDRNLRERLLEELPTILRYVGVTTITVTHDQEEAFALADRVILLHGGRVVQAGRPEEVYAAPADAWVARFLGLDNLAPSTVISTHPPRVRTVWGVWGMGKGAHLPPPGARGTLLVYPWGIHLGEAPAEANVFTARVVQRAYRGHTYHITLASPGGERLRMVQGMHLLPPAVGATVQGWVEPTALRWLDGAKVGQNT